MPLNSCSVLDIYRHVSKPLEQLLCQNRVKHIPKILHKKSNNFLDGESIGFLHDMENLFPTQPDKIKELMEKLEIVLHNIEQYHEHYRVISNMIDKPIRLFNFTNDDDSNSSIDRAYSVWINQMEYGKVIEETYQPWFIERVKKYAIIVIGNETFIPTFLTSNKSTIHATHTIESMDYYENEQGKFVDVQIYQLFPSKNLSNRNIFPRNSIFNTHQRMDTIISKMGLCIKRDLVVKLFRIGDVRVTIYYVKYDFTDYGNDGIVVPTNIYINFDFKNDSALVDYLKNCLENRKKIKPMILKMPKKYRMNDSIELTLNKMNIRTCGNGFSCTTDTTLPVLEPVNNPTGNVGTVFQGIIIQNGQNDYTCRVGSKDMLVSRIIGGYLYGYKIAKKDNDFCMIKLKIPHHAIICDNGGVKFRTNYCIPIGIFKIVRNPDGSVLFNMISENDATACIVNIVQGLENTQFIYQYMKFIKINPFDPHVGNVCIAGIHFCLEIENALDFINLFDKTFVPPYNILNKQDLIDYDKDIEQSISEFVSLQETKEKETRQEVINISFDSAQEILLEEKMLEINIGLDRAQSILLEEKNLVINIAQRILLEEENLARHIKLQIMKPEDIQIADGIGGRYFSDDELFMDFYETCPIRRNKVAPLNTEEVKPLLEDAMKEKRD